MKVILYQKHYNREIIAKETDKVFLFGDNTQDRTITKHVPYITQAVIRGLSNVIGIDTKKHVIRIIQHIYQIMILSGLKRMWILKLRQLLIAVRLL